MNSSKLLIERIGLFPSSGNIHIVVASPLTIIQRMQHLYASHCLDIVESCSALSMVFADWRFNLQISQSLSICLRVESRGDVQYMRLKTAELLADIFCSEGQP